MTGKNCEKKKDQSKNKVIEYLLTSTNTKL